MTPAEQSQVDAIERDRKRRENELLLLMLLLFGTARRHATSAIRLGHDPVAAARNVVLGNPALDLAGLALPVAKLLAVAHTDGIRRAAKIAGAKVPDVTVPDYAAAAQRVAQGMADTLGTKIAGAVNDARTAGLGAKKTAAAVREAVKEAGYGGGESGPFLLTTVAEAQIVNAHTAGMAAGANALPDVWGYRFKAVRDEATTVICKTCDGTVLPKDHPWWQTHTPSMHFGCRSCLLIVRIGSAQAVATSFPLISAAPGFGRPWLGQAA